MGLHGKTLQDGSPLQVWVKKPALDVPTALSLVGEWVSQRERVEEAQSFSGQRGSDMYRNRDARAVSQQGVFQGAQLNNTRTIEFDGPRNPTPEQRKGMLVAKKPAIDGALKSLESSRQNSPASGKGGGKGKGKGNGHKFNKWNVDPPKFNASIQCKFCGRKGHYDTKCWDKFPEQRPKSWGAAGTAEEKKSTHTQFGRNDKQGKYRDKKGYQNRPQAQSSNASEGQKAPQSNGENSKKRKAEVLLLSGCTMSTRASVNGVSVSAIVDTGATISCVAKSFVSDQALQKDNAILVEVGNGATLFTLGTTELTLQFGSKVLTHKAYVLDTNAFEAVLGMDFLSSPRCTGIFTFPSPPKLMVDGELFILQ